MAVDGPGQEAAAARVHVAERLFAGKFPHCGDFAVFHAYAGAHGAVFKNGGAAVNYRVKHNAPPVV